MEAHVRNGWKADVEDNGELVHHVSMLRVRRFLALLWNPAKDRPQSAWMVNLAVALIMTPPVILLPNTINFFLRPLWMFDSWSDFGFFAGFYALPWTLAGMLLHAVTAAEGETDRPKGDH